MKILIKRILGHFGFTILRQATLDMYKFDVIGALCRLLTQNVLSEKEKRFLRLASSQLICCNGKLYSQLGQDLLALSMAPEMQPGFYIEIGGGDPERSSNSFLLQSRFNWRGVIVEPNPELAQLIKLKRSGPYAPLVIEKAISKQTGYELFLKAGLLGTLSRYIDGDEHSKKRKLNRSKESVIKVETISPDDFVSGYLPVDCTVDFLSIDTEGAEWEIIKSWPFKSIRPKVMVIEHNNRNWYQDLVDFCISNGYIHVLKNISKFDAWFILDETYVNKVENTPSE